MSDPAEKLTISFETHAQDLLLAARVFDQKNRRGRAIQMLGIMALVLMFGNYAFQEPDNLLNWVMLVVALAFGWFVWRFPDLSNRRYAARKAEHSPRFTLAFDEEGIDVSESPAAYRIPYEGGSPVAAWEYDGVITLCCEKNRLIAVPTSQMEPADADRVRVALRQGLGDRYEIVNELKKQL